VKGAALQVAALIAAAASTTACGKRGAPLPPLRPVPVAVTEFNAERVADTVTLRFVIPDANLDKSTPPRIDAVEVYAVTQPASAPAPTPAQLAVPSYRIATLSVTRDDKTSAKGGAAARTKPGDHASIVDKIAETHSTTPVVRYYAAAGMVGRRQGPVGAILALPLEAASDAPSGLKVDYTEKTFVMSWTAASAADRFIVEEVDESGAAARRLTPEPVSAEFTLPVEFGRRRCFAVRAVKSGKGTLSVDPATPAECVTATDHFAPAAPAALQAFAAEGSIDLLWSASPAPDLAGYIVLRGEGADGTLQRLTTALIDTQQYKDATVRAGVTYVYQVVAVDKATPPNQSEGSNRVTVTAR